MVDGVVDATGVVALGSDSGVLVMHVLLTVGVCLPLFFIERELKAEHPMRRVAVCISLVRHSPLSFFDSVASDHPRRLRTGANRGGHD